MLSPSRGGEGGRSSGCKIVSWNVAGLGSLNQRLLQDSSSLSLHQGGSGEEEGGSIVPPLELYLRRMRADVVALQEVKLDLKKLKSTAGDDGGIAFKFSDEWEAFFSPCKDKKVGTGFNGVATYVRTSGHAARCVSADCRPLQDDELDKMGR